MLIYVLRSYINEVQIFGSVKIKPNHFVEVEKSAIDGLEPEAKAAMKQAKALRRLSIQLVNDGKPVHEMNEQFVLQRESERG